MKFSWLTAILKATAKTIVPLIVLGLTILIEHPEIVNKLLGNLGSLTIAGIVLWVVQFVLNWLKNRNLGK